MTLLVDVGNSCIKWALLEQGRLAPMRRESHSRPPTAEELEMWWGAMSPPRKVLICNVAGERAASQLSRWMKERWRVAPAFLQARSEAFGVRNGYREPVRLGADRWAALLGARQLTREAVCVVDCGSAITVDVMDAAGQHRGGAIAPGLALMRRALIDGTGIGRSAAGLSSDFPATSTEQAVEAGVLAAAAGGIERSLALAQREIGAAVCCLMTGGDAGRLIATVRWPCRHVPELVLLGLAVAAGEPPGDEP